MSRQQKSRTSRIAAALTGPLTLGVGAAILTGAVTWALLSTGETFAGGAVTAGDLQVTSGTATWRQLTGTGASGTLDGSPLDLAAVPGDVVEIRQPITTTLRGENLVAAVAVDVPAQVERDLADSDLSVTYRLLDADGTQVAPATGSADLGTPLAVPGLTGTSSGADASWTLVLRVEVGGDYLWTSTPAEPAALWPGGSLDVHLTQVRPDQDGGAR